jgi:effector-binding domain-containing protein
MHMQGTPEIVTRAAQPYAAVRAKVTMAELGGLGPRLGEVFGWLGARGIDPAGPPFFRYNVIDMDRLLDVEAGVPVARETSGDDQVLTGVLPAGQYATALFQGHPSELVGAVADLLEWADGEHLTWDVWPGEDGEHWGCRLENYLTDPAAEPDMSKWVTELSFRLAD